MHTPEVSEVNEKPVLRLFYWKSGEKFVAINLHYKITAASDHSAAKFFPSESHALAWRNSYRLLYVINSQAMPLDESNWTLHQCSLD